MYNLSHPQIFPIYLAAGNDPEVIALPQLDHNEFSNNLQADHY